MLFRSIIIFCLGIAATATTNAASNVTTNAPTNQMCECHVLCDALTEEVNYIGNKRTLRNITLADNGWLFRSQIDLGYNEPYHPKGYREFVSFLDYLSDNKVRYAIVELPPRSLFNRSAFDDADIQRVQDDYLARQKKWQSLGAIVPDWGRLLNRDLPDPFYFSRDTHWTPEGAQHVAELLAQAIRWQGRRSFAVARGGITRLNGDMQKFVETHCPARFPFEFHRQYTTTETSTLQTAPVNTGLGDSDSLAESDEAEYSDVLLVGSSNSDSKFNFSGFLSESLKAKVRTITSQDVSFFSFPNLTQGTIARGTSETRSRENEQPDPRLPKWIVFEIPAGEVFKPSSVYAKVNRRRYTKCESPVLSGKATKPRNNVDVIINQNSLKIDPTTHYVYISSNNGAAISGTIKLWYPAGSTREVKIKSTTAPNVALDLPQLTNWVNRPIVALDYVSETGADVDLTIDVCAVP